ncbi:MAG: hypothetical protein KAX89_08935 [Propionivibrio sp.]|nr:hypothetical protein [Propionivibrio sp.]
MTGGEEEPKKAEGKGFAGLSSLVSDVDTTPPAPAPKKEPAAAAPSAGHPSSQPAQPQPQPSQRQTYQEPAQPSSGGSSGGKWVLGIAAVMGVLWLIGQSDKNTTSPAPAYSPPAHSTAPSYAPPPQPQAPSRPVETKPPVGQDLVLSREQIRYCLAEDIRIDGAKSALNNYIDADVDRFNAMVGDYNSRCSSFKYQTNNRGRNDLNSSQRDIEPFRSQLQSEGRRRFVRSPSTGSLSAPTYDTEGWTEESTNSTDVGPWLNYDPPGTRYYRDANNVIYRVFPPGVRPNAHAANPFGLGDSTERPQ